MKNLSSRERKIMWACGLTLIAYLTYNFVAHPLYEKQKRADQKIQSKILFINKYYAILNQKDYFQRKEAAAKQLERELNQKFLTPPQPALAAANLQKILESQARSHAVNIVQVKTEKPKFMERLLTVPVKLTVRSNLRNLMQFLHRVENHSKFLVVENLQSRRVNKSEPEHLETRLLISGFIQQLEAESKKKKKT